MMRKKWQDITTANEVYCSSTIDYFVAVLLHAGLGRAQRSYHINSGTFEGKRGGMIPAPKYIQAEVGRQLYEKFTNGKLIIAEGTGDGRKRTTNLRYHDRDYLEQLLNRRG